MSMKNINSQVSDFRDSPKKKVSAKAPMMVAVQKLIRIVSLEPIFESAKNKATRWYKKVHGGSAGIPPAFTLRQCLWTFIGVIITHTILSRINLLVKTESDGDLSLILAPLGKFEPSFSTLDAVIFLQTQLISILP